MKQADIAWIALSLLPRMGNKTLQHLLDVFGSCEAILEAEKADLLALKGIGEKTAHAIKAINLEALAVEIETWRKAGVQIIPQFLPAYPPMLKTIPDPPLCLFARGKYQPQVWEKAIAIVGTRNPSRGASYLATKLSKNFSEAAWWIVSGLALGIDAAAHHGALDSGRTMAVLGGGVLNIYPPEHHHLAQEILVKGALLSENAPNATATAPRLVVRNRLISAFARHLIVVETALEGGAMHAARAAIEQGRQVYTFDLPVSGNQALIANGAKIMDITCSPF